MASLTEAITSLVRLCACDWDILKARGVLRCEPHLPGAPCPLRTDSRSPDKNRAPPVPPIQSVNRCHQMRLVFWLGIFQIKFALVERGTGEIQQYHARFLQLVSVFINPAHSHASCLDQNGCVCSWPAQWHDYSARKLGWWPKRRTVRKDIKLARETPLLPEFFCRA